MTEQEQFNSFGCVSRSLLKYLEFALPEITKPIFIERFRSYFPEGELGLLTIDTFCAVVKELGICKEIYSVRSQKVAKRAIDNGQAVFALTDLKINENNEIVGELFHCRLCLNVKGSERDPESISEILLFSPSQDGTDKEVPVSIRVLEIQLVHFLVLA